MDELSEEIKLQEEEKLFTKKELQAFGEFMRDEGKTQAISEFKEKLKDKLFYGDYLHFKKDEKKIISNLLEKTAQEIK